MKQATATIYEPNRYVKAGPFSLFREMAADLCKGNELGWRLFLRDFTARYRQSLLGPLWVVLMPLFTVAIFAAMNRAGVLKPGETGVPYPVFVLFGVSVWSLFSGLTSSISGVVGSCGGLITKINFPRIALVHSPVLMSLCDFLVRCVLLAMVMAWAHVSVGIGSLLFLFSLFPLVLLSIGLGMALSIAGALVKDMANFVSLILTVLMLVTPVVYQIPGQGALMRINVYNPMYYLIDIPRALLFGNAVCHQTGYLVSSALALAVCILGWRFYQVAMGRIVEKA